ncbi:flagellar hook-associated protein FlgK [Kiloniella sp.]|uniref:flagellar hook-associated protein FlgK n=1 Tax=Kiloniella sp. TaxID=1938587 RepID=UPI003B019DB2
MTLTSALHTATNALLVTQSGISVASSNVSNAGTEGYTRKTLSTDSVVLSGYGAGVTSGGVTSSADPFLTASIVEQSSDAGEANVIAMYLDWLQQGLGSTSSETNLTADVASLVSELQSLSTTPESDSQAALVVSAAEDLAQELSTQSSNIQELRDQANNDIAQSVSDINQSLEVIDQLNEQILLANSQGTSTLDLEDKRALELEKLATELDISYFTTSDNQTYVYTSSGQPLVDSQVHELSYDPAANVDAAMTYPGGFDAITLNGKDITEDISGGELGGFIALRDDILPEQQETLDVMAHSLISEINAVYENGVAYPAPATITGTESFTGADAFSATGEVRVALVDSEGSLQSYQDVDLSALATIDDVVSALDSITGISASLSSDGNLLIESDDPSMGIGLSQLDSAVGGDADSFSSYFGVQQFFTGTSASDIAVSETLKNDPGSLATGQLDTSATLTVGDNVISVGDSSISEALYDVMTSSTTLGSTTDTYESYSADYVATVAQDAANAQTTADAEQLSLDNLKTELSNKTGVNVDEELAYITQLENQYAAAAAIIDTLQSLFDELISTVR